MKFHRLGGAVLLSALAILAVPAPAHADHRHDGYCGHSRYSRSYRPAYRYRYSYAPRYYYYDGPRYRYYGRPHVRYYAPYRHRPGLRIHLSF